MADRGLRPGRFVAIHPGSGGLAKIWPFERFVALAVAAREHGWPCCWLLGEVEAPLLEPLRRRSLGPTASALPPRLLAGVLALSRAYVGNDSGVSHLAAVTGVDSWVLFGSASDPVRWAPIGARVVGFDIAPTSLWLQIRGTLGA